MKKILALVLALLVLTGCDFDAYDLPLPGGAEVGADPIEVTVQFADVLDLVPDSAVKVNEVSVGKVTDVRLVDGHAEVGLELRKDTELPANAVAEIRQTSLLGEKFVSLAAPADPAAAKLTTGDTIPLARSGRNPEVEEVLGALSLVLNGGGVAQLKTITTELNKALGGREDIARSVLDQVDYLVANLDDNKTAIVNAIDALDRVAKQARQQEPAIDQALAELPSALQSIDAQRQDLVAMLQALSKLGDVGTRVITASKDSVIRTVDNLQPTLTQLADAGDDLVNSIDTALTYPFVDDVVGRDPQVARNIAMGDYVNLSIQLDIDLASPASALVSSPLPSDLEPTKIVFELADCLASASLDSEACQYILGLPGGLLDIANECQKSGNRDTALCLTLAQLPGGIDGLISDLLGLDGASTAVATPVTPGASPSSGCNVLGLPICLRAAPGSAAGSGLPEPGADGKSQVTYEQLATVYDPSLVRLLMPGLDTADRSQQ
ncbi:MCE family protein [Nocardioides sp.]|uniref:MCE family protein n=1 Tax=Nocardioides sp. TaxID=35761 RepID=UPI0039E2F2F7